jgi:KDO2-lipid IV(A) lauroyltransferase
MKKTTVKRIWQWLVVRAFHAAISLARVVPLRVLHNIAGGMGLIGYALSKRYRNVSMKNLNLAYGDTLSLAEKKAITRKVFINFGIAALAEFPYMSHYSNDDIIRIVKISKEDIDYIRSIKDSGRGILFISGHIGNFEVGARRIVIEGHRVSVVARMDNNQVMADLFNGIRNQGGYDVLGRGNAIRTVIKRLKEGEIVAMLPDQKSDDVWVPFFGQLSGTVGGPAVIAMRTGAAIIPCYCIRNDAGSYTAIVEPEIDTHATSDHHADCVRIMTDVNASLERIIRKYPDQWLWLHDRWKVTPPEEELEKWRREHP